MYLGAMLSASQAPVEPALEGRRRTCRSWTAQHQRTAGSPAGRASARARVVNRWPGRLCRSAMELLPRRAGHAYPYGAGTLDGTGACAGRAGCWEPLAPGSSFCWGPELQGSTSPSSSRSSTRRRAGRDRREVRRARAPAPPVQAPATPPAPRTDPAPSRRFAPPTRRLARLASTSPPLARVCAGAQCCPSTSTRVEGGAPRRRSVCGAARAGRGGAWAPRGDEGGGVGARRGHLQGGQRWAKKGHRILTVFFFKRRDLFFRV